MPLIRSRKYGHIEQVVSIETWKLMQAKGLDSRYIVVDNSDIQETVIRKPEIFEPTIIETHTSNKEYNDITKTELMDVLSERGVEYPLTATKKELYQLYNG